MFLSLHCTALNVFPVLGLLEAVPLDQDSFVAAKGGYKATQQPLHLLSTVSIYPPRLSGCWECFWRVTGGQKGDAESDPTAGLSLPGRRDSGDTSTKGV